jgi:hypothetical protein
MATASKISLKVADEAWIVTALLHRELPRRSDFRVEEIVRRAEHERLTGRLRPGLRVHILQHCVANRPPNPARYRMLFATGKLTRRLFRRGDTYHPARENAKVTPAKEDIPTEYHYLVDWYSTSYDRRGAAADKEDPILALRGLGKEIWKGENPDSYVRRLRKGWQ